MIGLSSPAMAQSARMGKNFDEIVTLAKNEGGVRTAAGWDPENVRIILKGFQQKYPMVKIQHTEVTGIASRERILNEALGGIFEHDLVNVSGELRQQYIKAGVLASPVEWSKLFPDIKAAHISPDKYFVIGGFSTYGIVYNPSLVPPERIPKRWEDCLDP
ncbi:MAG: ABC transporter substrate-binding protein, partial [Candidatus Binatia bacterium]